MSVNGECVEGGGVEVSMGSVVNECERWGVCGRWV